MDQSDCLRSSTDGFEIFLMCALLATSVCLFRGVMHFIAVVKGAIVDRFSSSWTGTGSALR